MTIGTDLRTWLLSKTPVAAVVGKRVHQNKVPQGYEGPYIWYGRATTENEDALDDAAGTAPFSQAFDVESISDDIDTALEGANALKGLHLSRGSFGSGTVQGVFVSDHQDDYFPRGVDSDDGRHVASLRFEIFGYTGT